MTISAGLDVGGAHLKLALTGPGGVMAVRQIVCPLWQGLDRLEAALAEARPFLAPASSYALTMTGELSDLFLDRRTGVHVLLDRLEREFGVAARVWMGRRGLGPLEQARKHPDDVGSTNFLATAAFVARHHRNALLVDFGSTTADIVPMREGEPDALGLNDADRQTTGELVYTGYTRTAVMGVATRAPFRGQWVTLAREYLATMADVRRILGIDLTEIDLHGTADGKDKSLASSVQRLARMLGRDAATGTDADWRMVAEHIHETQLRSIHDGALQVLSRTPLTPGAPVIAAGIGEVAVRELARRLGHRCQTFGSLAGGTPDLEFWATACAPAVAVAMLANG